MRLDRHGGPSSLDNWIARQWNCQLTWHLVQSMKGPLRILSERVDLLEILTELKK